MNDENECFACGMSDVQIPGRSNLIQFTTERHHLFFSFLFIYLFFKQDATNTGTRTHFLHSSTQEDVKGASYSKPCDHEAKILSYRSHLKIAQRKVWDSVPLRLESSIPSPVADSRVCAETYIFKIVLC